jgi:hypothetical protein
MTLENLLKIGRLSAHVADARELQRLFAAIRRNLTDAKLQAVSPENRFDAAYKAIMQTAMVAMLANGYRPSTSEPGHHATLIQTLPLTLGVATDRWVVLDALRRKRNLSDYMGAEIDETVVKECLNEADALLRDLNDWLKRNKPDLILAAAKPK